ncbi:hypothetical protein [Marinobacter sp. LN3S78]|uniref:pilus assembly PilX family protein n=1 Tax=Marinobacter sp. LN3S78 TaxID=3382300 RepID=UPI00387B929F
MFPDAKTVSKFVVSQRGAGLPIALFIITVLSLIVLTMADLQDSGSRSVSLQIQSQRAFFAAESGAQLTLARILPNTENAGEVWSQVQVKNINSSPPIEFGVAGLSDCRADIQVESEEVSSEDGATTSVVWVRVSSTGICGDDGPDRAKRTVEVLVR